MRSSGESTMLRAFKEWEQMGVSTISCAPGATIGPPAERLYAVEPVGVAAMMPSAIYSLKNTSFKYTWKCSICSTSCLVRTISFKAIPFTIFCAPTTLPSSIMRFSSVKESYKRASSTGSMDSSRDTWVRYPRCPMLMPIMGRSRLIKSLDAWIRVPSPPRVMIHSVSAGI